MHLDQSEAVVFLFWVLGLAERPKVSFIGEFSPNFDLKIYDSTNTKDFPWKPYLPDFFKESSSQIFRLLR
jgi:hypothetical protein